MARLVYVNLDRSYVFLGLHAALAVLRADLLRAADRLASLFAPFQYGISYLLPVDNGPSRYAVGIGSYRPREPGSRQSRETMLQLSKWQDQFLTTQSYLHGSFRDVYPANLLCEDHVRAALPGGKTLETLGIGRLTLLGPGKWLWEVSDDEIPRARAVLREAGLLISRVIMPPTQAGGGTFTNAATGIITVNGGTGGGRSIDGTLVNQGLLSVDTGTQWAGDVTNAGTIDVAAGVEVDLWGLDGASPP